MNPAKIPSFLRRALVDWRNRIFLESDLRRATPVIVYQMGKVGSTSIYHSLCRHYSGVVLHTHWFSQEDKDPRVRRVHRWAIAEGRPLNIVSLVREPIGRNVSAFFENFRRDTGFAYSNSKLTIEDLTRLFLANYRHDTPLKWFDRCILAGFGIDVFATPFPESGVCTYARNNVRLLVARCEAEDAVKAGAIGDFLNIRGFKITNANIGEVKKYAPTYRAFKSSALLPSEYISRMCDSRYFNHFYPKDFVDATRAKWGRR